MNSRTECVSLVPLIIEQVRNPQREQPNSVCVIGSAYNRAGEKSSK